MRRNNSESVTEKFARKREIASAEREKKLIEIHSKIPETFDIDKELAATSLTILNIAMSGKDVAEKMDELKNRNAEIRQKRASLLEKAGFPADYTDIHYECPKCGDTGFIGINMCECLKKEAALAAFEDSGIGTLVRTQSFETFSFDYYKGDALKFMKANFSVLKSFADNFSPDDPKNFLLLGHTGLGKTHLSTSVAKTVIEKGYKVAYGTINDIISDFEAERFRGTVTDEDIADRYYKSDLLIIDDLGCEMSNQFTVACVYNLINTRINNRRSTLINTNLSYDELMECYSDRITSRILGEFRPLMFKGEDIRRQKLSLN